MPHKKLILIILVVFFTWHNLCYDGPMTVIKKNLNDSISAKNISRIVNGDKVKDGSRLFQVALFRRDRFICGGSLLSRRFVLTAAHCVEKIEKKQDLQIGFASKQYTKMVKQSVSKIFKHPEYLAKSAQNDIAMIRLSYPLISIPYKIGFIELFKSDNSIQCSSPAVNSTLIVSGWGRTGHDQPISEDLLMAPLILVSPEDCQQKWNAVLNINGESMMCAYDRDKSSCHGDSGGPLTFENRLIGIVSIGSPNCQSNERPNIYTKVTHYQKWIDHLIQTYS